MPNANVCFQSRGARTGISCYPQFSVPKLTQYFLAQAAQILYSQQQRQQSNPPCNAAQSQLQYQSKPPPAIPKPAQQLQAQPSPNLSSKGSYNNTHFNQNAASSPLPQSHGFAPPSQAHHGRLSPLSRPPGTPEPSSSSADASLFPLFKAVDTAGVGRLTERELGKALVNGDFTSFDLHTVKMMIRMFDADRDGGINFQEFWCNLLLFSRRRRQS